jgi:hypothetical protein
MVPLAAMCFIERRSPQPSVCRPITSGRAATRLMANALNLLAHAGGGLDAALTISQALPCYEIDSSDLDRACTAIDRLLAEDTPAPF